MRTLRFKKIDAFAGSNSNGNPAAVIYLNSLDEISDSEKLQIAKELKGFISEVGFVSPSANPHISRTPKSADFHSTA